jgi:hypothetical protein
MNYKPVQGKTLISPLKEIKVTRTVTEPSGEKDADGIMQVTKTKTKVRANFQLGTVLVSNVFAAGDIVVYRPAVAVEFDLIKGAKLIDDYAIVGQWFSEEDK